jgi:hypothetical protein
MQPFENQFVEEDLFSRRRSSVGAPLGDPLLTDRFNALNI